MKTWLKGGLIGAGIGILSAILIRFLDIYWLRLPSILFIWVPLINKSTLFLGLPLNIKILFNQVLFILVYFIIGAIIGLIIQKIKSK